MTKISNGWITLTEQRNGVTVQRKFAGLDTKINTEDDVTHCLVYYWEKELYPNGETIKTELKNYSLEDLAYTEVEGGHMEPLSVLGGFIQALGQPSIVNPARETLENTIILPLNVENGYPLRRDTREVITE